MNMWLETIFKDSINKTSKQSGKDKIASLVKITSEKVCTFCGIYERLFKKNSMIQTRYHCKVWLI